MYNCRFCGGNLRFDIPTQRLKCPYCDSDFDCYEFEDQETTDSPDSYDVTVFSCPACGGEIVSTDQAVSEFCSYCGSSVVLEARLRQEKRPQKILPFKKTEEDCIAAYKKKLGSAIFAPKALKDPKFLENFRGIYIPYWSYHFNHQGPVTLHSTHEYRSGDYDMTDHYRVTGMVDATYDDVLFDASSSFDDSISGAIAPYNPKEMKPFVPSYLSGFYADVADVPSELYLDDANNMVNDATIDVIQRDPKAGKYTISRDKSTDYTNKNLSTRIGEAQATMLPVWFLTWRDRDRVAYIAVNGQSGKVAADIPIDVRKYVLAALLCAIPIYFIINIIFSFTAPTTLFLAGFFALISGAIYYEEIEAIRKKDSRVMDRGYQMKQRQKGDHGKEPLQEGNQEGVGQSIQTELPEEDTASKNIPLEGIPLEDIPLEKMTAAQRNSKKGKERLKQSRKKTEGKSKKNGSEKEKKSLFEKVLDYCLILSLIVLVINIFRSYMLSNSILSAIFNRLTLNFLLIAGVFILWWYISLDNDSKGKDADDYKPQLGILGSQLVSILASIINIIHPVSDLIYYIAIIIVYAGIFSTLIQVIRKHNLLITRPIPELHNRGKEQP